MDCFPVSDETPYACHHARPRRRRPFGQFGGRYIPETLFPGPGRADAQYDQAAADPGLPGGARTACTSTMSAGRRRCILPGG